MRLIIYGVGAIGGTLATRLHLAGHDVLGIARGAQLERVRRDGLTLRTPTETVNARFPVAAGPEEIAFEPDDAILLTVKGQDTQEALMRLRSAGVRSQPIFCFQNGVANEALALRLFENVYGVTVMLPADFDTPGEVAAYCTPLTGFFEVGRYPAGSDEVAEALCDMLRSAGFGATARGDVMGSKYRKLLMNLQNISEVVFGDEQLRKAWNLKLRAEGEAVLTAAGIEWDASDAMARSEMRMSTIPGRDRVGNSTLQSVVRGTGSVETDYLNGEIVLLGRLHGVPTPVNAAFCALSAQIANGRLKPQSATDETVLAAQAGATERRPKG